MSLYYGIRLKVVIKRVEYPMRYTVGCDIVMKQSEPWSKARSVNRKVLCTSASGFRTLVNNRSG